MSALGRLWPTGSGWFLLLGLGCAGIGALAGVSPGYGVAAAVGIAFTAVVIGDPGVGLVLFTILSFLDVINSGGAAASFMKVAGLLLFGSWLASASIRDRRLSTTLVQTNPGLVAASVGFLGWSAMSAAWSQSPGLAFTDTYRYLLLMILIPVVFGIVRRRELVFWIAGAFLLGAIISAVYGFVSPSATVGNQVNQLTGTIGDANTEAADLVGALALAVGLMGAYKHRPVLRFLIGVGAALAVAGVLNTLSRSGLIALGSIMLAGIVVGGRWRRWAVLLTVVGVVGTVGYFAALAPPSARARVTMTDTSGRSTLWAVAWRVVEAHPLIGVGSGNFQIEAIHYLQRSGPLTRADLIVDTPKVAHNIYLEVLSDMGLVGLVFFLGIIGSCLAAAWRAAQAFERTGDLALELMARCVILAIIGFMTSDFFLSGEFSKQLWLVLALGPTLLVLSRVEATDQGPTVPLDEAPRPRQAASRVGA